MRTVGIALLGLVGGLLFAIVVQDVLARILLGNGPQSQAGMVEVALGSLLPGCAVLGPVVALLLDRRQQRSSNEEEHHE